MSLGGISRHSDPAACKALRGSCKRRSPDAFVGTLAPLGAARPQAADNTQVECDSNRSRRRKLAVGIGRVAGSIERRRGAPRRRRANRAGAARSLKGRTKIPGAAGRSRGARLTRIGALICSKCPKVPKYQGFSALHGAPGLPPWDRRPLGEMGNAAAQTSTRDASGARPELVQRPGDAFRDAASVWAWRGPRFEPGCVRAGRVR